MDAIEKKFILQFDDMPGVRQNAFEALCEHRKKADLSWRDFVADLETALPKAEADELNAKLAEYAKLNAAAKKNDAIYRAEIKALKGALWVKANWKITGSIAASVIVLLTFYWSYERYWSRSEAVNMGLRAIVAEANWGEGWGEPFAARVGGEPYWIMFRGDIDASRYSDSRGNPVEMRCLHLYGAPAQPDSTEYLKPSPRNFLGVMKWPELAVKCRPSPNQQADTDK